MSAIESSIEDFKRICTLAETRIDDYFRKLDALDLEGKSQIDTLRITALSEEIANELHLKQQECMYSICLYLKNRPELEIRAGKNGGICRIGDERVKTVMTPKECALKNYQAVKDCAFKVIEEAFEKEEPVAGKPTKLNFQQLAQTIADMLKIKQYAAYHCLKSYIEDERHDLVIDLGRHGGLRKR